MKYYKLIGLILFTLLAIKLIYDSNIEYNLAEQEGQNVKCLIVGVQSNCTQKNNSIKVNYRNQIYEVRINSQECRERKFSVGDKVLLVYVSRYDRLFFKNENAAFWYYFSVCSLLLPLAFLIEIIRNGLK